jgi:hypothetical protein
MQYGFFDSHNLFTANIQPLDALHKIQLLTVAVFWQNIAFASIEINAISYQFPRDAVPFAQACRGNQVLAEALSALPLHDLDPMLRAIESALQLGRPRAVLS